MAEKIATNEKKILIAGFGGQGIVLVGNVMELAKRDDLDIVPIDATNLAIKMGNIKVANIIMLGVLIKKTRILKTESILKGMKRAFYKRKKGLYNINEDAFELGLSLSTCK